MREMKETVVGEYADVLSGYAFKSEDFSDKGTPVLKIKNVASGSLKMDDVQYYPFEITDRLKKFLVNKSDILIAMTGSHVTQPSSMVGKVCRYNLDYDSLLNQRVGKIFSKDKEQLNEDFIYYFFKQNDITIELASAAGGSANQANISPDQIKGLPILLPPIDEQRIIATTFKSIDAKIDLLSSQINTSEQLAETLFRQWFIEEADDSWEVGAIDDVVSMKGGTTPSTTEQRYWDGNIHWTSPRDLSNATSIYLFDTSRKITEDGLKQISSGLLPVGTLLLSSRAPIGYLAITEIPVAINQGYIAIICDKFVSNNFMFLWCKTNMDTIENAGNGSVFQEISKSAFRTLKFIVPPKEKLKKFDLEVAPLFQKIKSNTKQIQTLNKLRDTLLPKLMSGEVSIINDTEK